MDHDAASNSNSNSSNSNSNNKDPNYYVTLVTWKALRCFVQAVNTGLASPQSFPVQAQKDSSKSLTSSVTQQLQSNGLLQRIPEILQGAAQLLQQAPHTDTSATRAAVAVDSTSPGSPAASSSNASHSGSSSQHSSSGSYVAGVLPSNMVSTIGILISAATALALLQPSKSELFRTLDAAARLALAFMRHLTVVLAATPTGPPSTSYSAAAACCIKLLCAWTTGAAGIAPSLVEPSTAAAVVSLNCFTYYAQSLLPDKLSSRLASLSQSERYADSPDAAANAAAAAAYVTAHASEWRVGLLQHVAGLQETMQQQQQQKEQQQQEEQQEQDPVADVATDPCWLVTGGISMQAATWAGSCNFHWLKQGFCEAVRAAGIVQQRCWEEVPKLAEQQQQQQQQRQDPNQSSTPWLTHISSTSILQPVHGLLLSQLLLCSVERLCSNGADNALLAEYASIAALLAADAVRFTVEHQQAVQQEPFDILAAWLAPVLPATLQLLSNMVQVLDQADSSPAANSSSPAASSSSSSTLSASPSSSEPVEQICVLQLLQLLAASNYFTCALDKPAKPAAVAGLAAAAAGSSAQNATSNPGTKANSESFVGAVPAADQGASEASAATGYHSAAAWLTHHTELSRVLEGLCRVLGRHPVTELTANAVQLIGVFMMPTRSGGTSSLLLAYLTSSRVDGPASPEQLQLFGLLCSLLKVGRVMWPVYNAIADSVCWATGEFARLLVCESIAKLQRDPDHQPAEEVGLGSPGQPSAAILQGLMPLVLIGRCCLQWATGLGQLQGRSDLGQLLMQLQQGEPVSAWASTLGLVPLSGNCGYFHAAIAVLHGAKPLAMTVVGTCLEWLQLQGNAGQLAAAGYPAAALMQQLQAVLDVLPGPVNAADAAAAAAAFGLLAQRLQALGLALNTLAVPHACNNPACTMLEGPAKLVTVSRRSCMCAACRVARYCSRGCQKQHWKQHKPVCGALAGAAAQQGEV
jgi:hypothetical protein